MKKSKLKSGENMFVVNVSHYVKLKDFTTALTDHFYNNDEPFNIILKKSEARKILYHQLFFHGLNGEYNESYFEGSFEFSGAYNELYKKIKEWVALNYPYLNE